MDCGRKHAEKTHSDAPSEHNNYLTISEAVKTGGGFLGGGVFCFMLIVEFAVTKTGFLYYLLFIVPPETVKRKGGNRLETN